MNGLKGYLRQLNRALACPRGQRQQFLSETKRMAEDFLQGNPGATMEEVQSFLGDPQELAQTYLESIDPNVLSRYRIWRGRVKLSVIALFVAAFLGILMFSIYLYRQPITLTTETTLTIFS